MAISRTRGYAADRAGAEISGVPMALASALHKLAQGVARVPNPVVERNPAAAHLYIVHPAVGHGLDSLFSTHPDVGSRIAALQALAADPRFGVALFKGAPDISLVSSSTARRSALDPLADRKSTRLNSSHYCASRMPSSAG